MRSKSLLISGQRYIQWVMPALAGVAMALQAEVLRLSPAFVATGVALLLVCTGHLLEKAVRACGNEVTDRFRLLDALAMLPLILSVLLLFFEPLFEHMGNRLTLSIAGSIRFPWMTEPVRLSAGHYLWLLSLGGAWILTGALRLLHWFYAMIDATRKEGKYLSALLLLAMSLAAGLWWQGWAAAIYPPTGDEVHYLLMARSLVEDGDVDLKNDFEQKRWQPDYPGDSLDFHGHPDQQGRWFCRHMPGISVVVAPLYALLGAWGAALMNLCLLACALWMLYGLARDLGANPLQALWVYMIALISAPWTVWGYLIYPVMAGILLTLVGLRALTRLADAKVMFGLGLLSSLLPFFHNGFALIGLVFLAFAGLTLLRQRQFRSLGALVGGSLVTGLPFVWVFFHFYQAALQTGDYAFSFRLQFFLSAIIGQWVDRNYGVITAAPVLILAAAGWFRLPRQEQRWIAACLGTLVVLNLLQAALFVSWNGFSASFARFLAPAAAPVFAGLAFIRPLGKKTKPWFFSLAAYGMLVSLSTLIMPALLYELPKEKMLPLLETMHVPPVWKIFPILTGTPGGGSLVWGGVLMVAALGAGYWVWKNQAE